MLSILTTNVVLAYCSLPLSHKIATQLQICLSMQHPQQEEVRDQKPSVIESFCPGRKSFLDVSQQMFFSSHNLKLGYTALLVKIKAWKASI